MLYKFHLCFIGIAFLFVTTNAQTVTYKASICDKETKAIIPYATVQIANTLKYIDCDAKGYFEIEGKDADTLIVSCIGFNTLKMLAAKINTTDSFFLVKQVVKLNEVVIAKRELKTYGIVNEKPGISYTAGADAGRTEFTTLIEIPNDVKLYKISKLFIKGRNFNSENPLRIHIYDVDSNGFPGKELLTKETIVDNNAEVENKILSIDVKDQNIFLEGQSFFVGIQCLATAKVKIGKAPEIYSTYKVPRLLTFRRSLKVNHYNWYALFKKDIIFFPNGVVPKDDAPDNIMASAEIEQY
ncbi:MAG: carboxypeptidase-like regulatory domain-containing protein [Ferruginibacter sp.]